MIPHCRCWTSAPRQSLVSRAPQTSAHSTRAPSPPPTSPHLPLNHPSLNHLLFSLDGLNVCAELARCVPGFRFETVSHFLQVTGQSKGISVERPNRMYTVIRWQHRYVAPVSLSECDVSFLSHSRVLAFF